MAIVIVGTLDTKGAEHDFARGIIEDQGVDTHLIDAGVRGEPAVEADTPREEVVRRGGTELEELIDADDRGEAVDTMARGAAAVAADLHEEGVLEGILSLGGSAGTTIGTTAMRALPYGVPKVMVSTMASGDTRPYVESRDIAMLYSVADVAGLNQLTRTVISNAALAVVGMTTADPDFETPDKPTVGVTMFGVTTPCVTEARALLEERGYEVLTFHATGTGGKAMEELVEQDVIGGVLDVTTTELADELVGGVLSAGPDRLEAAGEAGVPQVVSVGALDMVNFGPRDSVPQEFEDRQFHVHNPTVTLMRTTSEENRELGRTLAEKVNRATGPTTVVLPTGGVSMIDVEGEDFYDPEADAALFDAIRETLNDDVELIEAETDVNDPEFARTLVDALTESLNDGR
ncbi:hypothetical protein BRC68_07825 [Halobacteriales archaeon QH_6_64_20]|nr:MAG: hypothetical protein BRC68_07825 [Halobacteriales archaeon QH_6_64_20]